MARWIQATLLLLLLCACAGRCEDSPPKYETATPINNVVQDPRTGRIYLGAVNAIYQLDSALLFQHKAMTGPKLDSRHCTPPIPPTCQDAKQTDSINKLLLVHKTNGSLVVCGTLFKGLCSLVNLSNIENQVYYSDGKGEKTYVASIEESVSVVGVMSTFPEKDDDTPVFLVAKGYGSQDSAKLISTRILQDYKEWVVFENIAEASSVQANPFVLKYLHNFRLAFKEDSFVYFVFSRTMGSTDNKNFTFISRLCDKDIHYYSYTELQLNCGPENTYNKVQTAYLASPGKKLAQHLTRSGKYGKVEPWDKVLFAVFSDDEDSVSSALCMYPLKAINKALEDLIGACYGTQGKINSQMAVYPPYISVTGFCSTTQPELAAKNPCGADFLTSPLASTPEFALKAPAVHEKKGLLTAVAVAVENDHTVAFLGTSKGEVYRVHLSSTSVAYGSVLGESTGSSVNKNLFFDTSQNYLYITTAQKITKLPVQECHLKTTCEACMKQNDPYCGWCVLEGKCSTMADCKGANVTNGWLWSPDQQCVEIKSFVPPNMSSRKTQQVEISVPSLPVIEESRLQCKFGSFSRE
ncbi:hypothetical protein AGOR_G00249350 [Albula goreensis]|uniref:Sema domain-containing protein n=1 Tax=Albula goreensis TaxID=1534307 RepID=A0A8T3CBG0_9TELE|nr:hypothetical protein AGOR_G00249350 [Albula goreensis]